MSRKKPARNPRSRARKRGQESARRRARSRARKAPSAGGADKPLIGTVSAHPDGFGFVDVPGRDKGFFLPPEEMRGLMHGDVVEIRPVRRRGRESASVVRIVEEASPILVGQLIRDRGAFWVEPRSSRQNIRILVGERDRGQAEEGDWVRVEIRRGTRPLKGRVLGVFGSWQLTPKQLIDIVVDELGLPHGFPDGVMEECRSIPERPKTRDFAGREDLRRLPFVTIDGEDARDFDDAICVLPRGEGFEAWVAIADVAHYVLRGSELDREARERGNSFYFPDRVIPMLPEKLSNGLCSLNPDVPRLTMAVRMRFDATGKRHGIHLAEAVIHSRARLTYAQAARWIEERDAEAVPDETVRKMLDDAARLYRKLARRRQLRGALDLDVPEVRAVLHEGRVADLAQSERNIAHHLIEEMMLAANTSVAEFLEARKCPFLYRVHPAPEPESIEQLNTWLAPFGLSIPIRRQGRRLVVRPADVQDVLEAAEGRPFEHVLHRLVLRAMQQARYSPENEGHFGLAYPTYCHFTSPIRRYADLTVHRRLKAVLRGEHPDRWQPAKELAEIGEHISRQERKQQRAEWDVQAMLGALYHEKDLGRELTARISGMTGRRLFVQFDETLAEGSMNVDALGARFELDESGHRLVARGSGKAYALGDPIRVRIDRVDPVRGQIEVSLAESGD